LSPFSLGLLFLFQPHFQPFDVIQPLQNTKGQSLHVSSPWVTREVEKEVDGSKARRWLLKACFSWRNRFRKLLVRNEKTNERYFDFI